MKSGPTGSPSGSPKHYVIGMNNMNNGMLTNGATGVVMNGIKPSVNTTMNTTVNTHQGFGSDNNSGTDSVNRGDHSTNPYNTNGGNNHHNKEGVIESTNGHGFDSLPHHHHNTDHTNHSSVDDGGDTNHGNNGVFEIVGSEDEEEAS